jgi:hypothetical protein
MIIRRRAEEKSAGRSLEVSRLNAERQCFEKALYSVWETL